MRSIRILTAAALLLSLTAIPLPCAAEEVSLGELNNDGAVNASDAAIVLIAAADYGANGTSSLSDAQSAAADLNGDKAVNASDAALILQYAAIRGGGSTLSVRLFLDGAEQTEAVFLGVNDWGKSTTKIANAEKFTYRFRIGDEEKLYKLDNSELNADGKKAYPIQNKLKVNYHFRITVKDGVVIDAEETETGLPTYTPLLGGTPGKHTVRNFLETAMAPIGTTVYMFGGGWSWSDNGSAPNARTIGVNPDWVRFWNEHDANYTYRDKDGNTKKPDPPNSYYPYGGFNQYHYAGLDCSGYVSWVIYNTMHDVSGEPGYVGKSTGIAKRLSGYGWGTWEHSFKTPTGTPETAMKPGDIMSMSGHVWISLGTCSDGSIVIAHSTPSYSHTGQPGGGVQIGAVGKSTSCEAYKLAEHYMTTYYPQWCERYVVTLKDTSYLSVSGSTETGRFRWNTTDPLTDPDGIQEMTADEALALLFGETEDMPEPTEEETPSEAEAAAE